MFGLFNRKPPEWQLYLSVSLVQPEGPGSLWFYEVSGKAPDGTVYRELSRKGYDNRLYARKAGEIMAGRVLGDAKNKGIVWARLDALPIPPRSDWRQWMVVSVNQPQGPKGLWFYQIAWKGADGTVNKEVSSDGFGYESAARETGENIAAHLYDRLVADGVVPASS